MKKSIIWIVGIIIVIAVIIGVTKSQPIESGPIKIGVIIPLSGNLAFLGEPAKQGAELALANFPNTKHKYELIFEDDQFSAEKAVTAANKLISIDKVSAIISFGSSGGNAINPLAEKNKIVHFGVASDPKVANGVYNFNHWTPPSEEVRAPVAELQKRNITKIGVLTANQDGMLAITSEIRKQIQGTNIQIVTDQTFNIGEKDFRSLIVKIKQNLPEIFVMVNYTPELEILAKQMKDSGIKTPMTSVEGFDQTTQLALFDGYWYASASDPTGDFTKLFTDRYGKAPGFGTGNAYDIVSLLVTASENANTRSNPTSDEIVSQLMKVNGFKGAMGVLSINSDGLVVSTATIKTVKVAK